MGLGVLFALAIGLSMDAFAVSICKGLALKNIALKHAIIVGAWFGGFQALMPLAGYFLGISFQDKIMAFDHWIAFGLLTLIGANMIWGALKKDDEEADSSLGFKNMLLLAVATSIDALAIGVSLAFLNVNIWAAIIFIGVTTFIISAIGVKVGSVFGTKYKAKAEIVGGVILIILGLKILFEHLGVF